LRWTDCLLAAALLVAPAVAMAEPSTRLVSCHDDDCLLVSGQRDDAAAAVRINGHSVTVEGGRRWRVRLPVETVRSWSSPFARTIAVTVLDPDTRGEKTAEADLPIGLLGHDVDFASLIVRVR
jgi:hypothetical protein